MINKAFMAAILTAALLISLVGVHVEVAKANPFSRPATVPIKDPPVITIQSPNNTTYFQDVIPLNITVIQPDSWVIDQNMNGASVWVVGPNTLRSVSCDLDGQSFILWDGTHASQKSLANNFTVNTVCYYLPKDAQFSAVMNVSRGQHTLQVKVGAVAEYYPHDNFPFPNGFDIEASQNVTFRVQAGSDIDWSSTINSIKAPSVPFPPTINLDTIITPSAKHNVNTHFVAYLIAKPKH